MLFNASAHRKSGKASQTVSVIFKNAENSDDSYNRILDFLTVVTYFTHPVLGTTTFKIDILNKIEDSPVTYNEGETCKYYVSLRGSASDKPKTFFCELEGIYARLESTILVSNFVSKLNDAIDSILGTNAHLSYYILSAIAEIGE